MWTLVLKRRERAFEVYRFIFFEVVEALCVWREDLWMDYSMEVYAPDGTFRMRVEGVH